MQPSQHTRKRLAILLIVTFLLASCSGLPSQTQATATPPPLPEVKPLVSATGVVTPAVYSNLSVTTPGVVEAVLVQVGDEVQAGQVLVRLKGKEDLQAAISAAQLELTAAEKALADLDKNAETARNQALNAIALAAKQVRDAQYQLDNFTVPSNQANLDAMQALDLMKQRLDEARTAFEPYRNKSENDPTRKELKRKLDEAQSDYNSAVRRLQLETELAVAQANLEKARKDYEIWKQGADPSDVKVAQARLDNAKAALTAAQAKFKDLELLAPFAGTVTELNVRVGEWVTPGLVILQVADLQHLRVETTDLNEIDVARLQLGDAVSVTFDALPDVEVRGKVQSIAPKSAKGTGVNYTVVVELEDWPATLRWGMTAFVDIQVE